MREGQQQPGRARCRLPARRCRAARRLADSRACAPPPRSGARHPSGTDCWSASDPRVRGGWCASQPGPEPVPSPWRGGSLASRPERPVCHGRPGRETRKPIPFRGLPPGSGAHQESAEVRIGPPCRFRAQVRLKGRARAAARPDPGERHLLHGRCRRDPWSLRGMPGWSPKTKRPLAAGPTTTGRSESPTTGHPTVGRSTAGTTANTAIKFRRPVRRLAMRRCN